MSVHFAAATGATVPLHVLSDTTFSTWLETQSDAVKAWITANGFEAGIGQALALPGPDGLSAAIVGVGNAKARKRGRFAFAAAFGQLPKADYAIETWPDDVDASIECFGALSHAYRFDRYRSQKAQRAALVAPASIDGKTVEHLVAGEALARDLINTPASDMGPPDLEKAARELAETHDASITVTTGDDLLAQNFPMIHTVGRAADRAPRLIDMAWGDGGPKVTLVGKGVCFDTGGLNLKPGGSMGLMKKDMGGAANVLGLADMLMRTNAALTLRVLIPAVENSVSGNAFRPQDVLTSRKGLTVEINNTDAEGRLVLADALALADEDRPDAIISMATLTGAARVAVGPDLAPFYTDDDALAAALKTAAENVADPVWQMPFHTPYEKMIEPGIADLDNAPSGGFAGSITAALFLRRFVTETPRYMHFDIYGWQPSAAPGRPKGGAAQGIRALHAILPECLK